MTTIYARQGDVVIRKAPIGDVTLAPATDLVVAGSTSAAHTIVGQCGYATSGRDTIVRIATDTTLSHAGRHLPISLPAGEYRFSPLRERGDATDRSVED